MILELARRLSGELRRRDPLAERVELGRVAFLRAALSGLARMPWSRRRRRLALAARGLGPGPRLPR